MKITESFSLDVKDYCEFCPYFRPYSDNVEVTTFGDLPSHKVFHYIKCEDADKCERLQARMRAEMEAQRENSEKVQSDDRGCENKGLENGADSDNGQPDGIETRISDVRQEENQSGIGESNKGRWQERLMKRFMRWH